MSEGYAQSRAFFESRYQSHPDPWNFAGSVYERERYRATLATLARPTYERVFEPGCSVGVLTQALSSRAQSVFACDISEVAVRRARDRCRDCANVRIEQADVGVGQLPAGTFDLIIFSEIGYYFSSQQLRALAQHLTSRLEPSGEFVAVNWLGSSPDHLLHGDEVVEVLNDALACDPLGGSRHSGFRLDSWRRSP